MGKTHRRKRPSSWPDWFVPKSYPHFDQPVRDPEQVRWLVETPEQVARHAFLPFIHFGKITRKYKRAEGHFIQKTRSLYYASHTDSQLFRRYGNELSARYETALTNGGFDGVALAYRRFEPRKCNIHFANDAFRWIEDHAPCVAMAFDVKDFFESLDHKMLKREWKELLGVESLPADHHAVFKAITRYAWVQREPLFARFGITKKKLADWRKPICSPAEFRAVVRTADPARNLIKVKMDGVGIPQGSPISALLSNIYMIPVDRRMATRAKECGALYCRYSDDILIACSSEHRTDLETELRSAMAAARLELHDGPGKVAVASFATTASGSLKSDKPLQYLGFAFDGQFVRIRSQTIARFLRKMRKAVRREKYLATARAEAGGDGRLRRKLLYSRYTHLGTNNFVTGYARNAREVIDRNAIRKQLRNHWPDLHALLLLDD